MATRRWKGGAAPVAQVQTFTVGGTVGASDTVTVTINGREVTYTLTGSEADTAEVATELQELLAASTYGEFQEITWTVSSSVVTGTAGTAGKPFTATASDSGTITLTGSVTTASSGPNYWSVASNWKEGSVPVSTDAVIIDEGPSILYGIDQNTVTLASLTIGQGFPVGSEIGLPDQTSPTNPSSGYTEYRDRRLKIGSTLINIDTQSRRIRLDTDTDTTTITVNGTGQSNSPLEPALDVIGTHASNILRVNRGNVWVAGFAGDTAQFASIDVTYQTSSAGDSNVKLGSGLTLATLVQSGGVVRVEGAITTITKEGGELTRTGTGAVTTLRNRVGTIYDSGTGTITTMHQSADYRRMGEASVTITNCTLYSDSVTLDANGTITFSNPITLSECHLAGPSNDRGPRPCWLNVGFGKTVAIA